MLNMMMLSNLMMSSMIAAGLLASGAGIKRACRMLLRRMAARA